MSIQNRLFTTMTPSFCSLTDTKQSLQYTIKTHLSGPPIPQFEANMNYISPSPPSFMKQCNKSATLKFHMELLLTRKQASTTTRKQSCSGATLECTHSKILIVSPLTIIVMTVPNTTRVTKLSRSLGLYSMLSV